MNNTNTNSALVNLDSLIYAVQISEGNDFLNSVQRVVKLATAAITKSVLKQALLANDFAPFGWDPYRVASQRETIDLELAAAIVKACKGLIWLNSQVKKITNGRCFINVYLNVDNDEAILNVCNDLMIAIAQEGAQNEIHN